MTQIIGNRYELIEQIGAGGMGTVFRGLDTKLDQTVAIKQLKPELVQADMIERFRREGEALRQLNHPNIVKLVATAQDGDQHYLVMEFASGGSLSDLLAKQGSVPADQMVSIALELADALARAHHLKVIHRDLKPANVLLAEDGTPRLSDFGVARTAQGNLTGTGVIVGTLSYLAPEILNGEPADARADIWAFGVTLFELLTGRVPFRADSPAALITAILNQLTPDLEALRPDLPVALVDLIYRMLDKDSRQRIGSMRMIAAELEAIREQRPSSASNPLQRKLPLTEPASVNDPTMVMTPPASKRDNLPVQTTPFVGRESELVELAKMIADPNTRLITILGPGGMGKTRLALEAAVSQIGTFQDGVYFVSLVPLSTPETIIPAIAECIRLFLADGADPQVQLLNYLQHKKMVLVLDNFEHILSGAPLASHILQAAAGVRIIATSRTKLALQEETLLRLEGMDFPDWETPEDAAEYSAVKLFLQSARRVQPNFELKADNLTYLARICRQVQGMPLGILLAAAWVDNLSLAEISNEIHRSLDFLETEQQNVPARQRSIHAVFGYSWNLLSADERAAFAKLSVFRGGFTREAAQTVAGASLRTLAALVNKSMLRRNGDSGRYEIHELLRQYAAEKLDGAGLTDVIQNEHAAYYAVWMNERWLDLKGRRQIAASRDMEVEFNNLRVAWLYLVSQCKTDNMADFASGLWILAELRPHRQEVADLFDQALKRLRPAPTESRQEFVLGLVLGLQGRNLNYLGSPEKGKMLAEEGIAILQHHDNPVALIQALHALYFCCVYLGDPATEQESSKQALQLARASNDRWALARSLYCAVGSLHTEAQRREALPLAQECLSVAEEIGDLWQVGAACNYLGNFIFPARKNYAEARRYGERALRVMEEIGSPRFTGMLLRQTAAFNLNIHDLAEARRYILRLLKFRKSNGGLPWELIEAVDSYVDLLRQESQNEQALTLVSMISQHPASIKSSLNWAEVKRGELQSQLPPEVYSAAWERGKALDLDTVVAGLCQE